MVSVESYSAVSAGAGDLLQEISAKANSRNKTFFIKHSSAPIRAQVTRYRREVQIGTTLAHAHPLLFAEFLQGGGL